MSADSDKAPPSKMSSMQQPRAGGQVDRSSSLAGPAPAPKSGGQVDRSRSRLPGPPPAAPPGEQTPSKSKDVMSTKQVMKMTIGAYLEADEAVPGTAWLLREDVHAANAKDVRAIYRSLGADSREYAATATFQQPRDTCFVGAEARTALMARLDAAFVASGSTEIDTKLDLTREELEAVLGAPVMAAMLEAFGAPVSEIKMRRVSSPPSSSPSEKSQKVIPFHFDKFTKTMGIALNDSSEYTGSRLTFALPSTGKLVQPNRRAGTATIHDNHIAHGVTPLVHGVRYGLFLLSKC